MNSIRLRLLLLLLATLAAVAVAMGAATYHNALAETEALFDYQLRQMALSLRDQGEIAPDQADALADEQLDFVVQIWTVDGRNIYATRAHTALPTRALLGLATINVDGQVWRTFSVATNQRVIQVAQPAQIRQRLAARAALRTVWPLVILAPLSAFGIWWLAALTLRPLRRVAADVRARDAQSLEPLEGRGLPDEIAPLVEALNALLLRLSGSLEAQRAFVADAAHELRSPLTALKLQLQLLRRAPDEAARGAAVDALTAGTDRASRLVEQLLTLARNEAGAAPAKLQAIDLAEVARQAMADTASFALSRRIELELFADRPAWVDGDAPGLTALVRNLVDNAVRYSPPSSKVEVTVMPQPEGTLLQVDDAGPGIAPAERERVFSRFYRQAPGEEQGTGLGLAIVREVALRHGAKVDLAASPAGGLRVAVRFPNVRLIDT